MQINDRQLKALTDNQLKALGVCSLLTTAFNSKQYMLMPNYAYWLEVIGIEPSVMETGISNKLIYYLNEAQLDQVEAYYAEHGSLPEFPLYVDKNI